MRLNNPNEPLRPGSHSPWGSIQHVETIVPGHVHSVSTASHGGWKVSPEYNRRIPAYMRNRSGWYEEDCECSIPMLVFADAVTANYADREGGPEYTAKMLKCAEDTLRNWMPDAYEKWFKRKLKPGESSTRDEQEFKTRHAQDWLMISAHTTASWAPNIPENFMGVTATIGGKNSVAEPPIKRYFIIPTAEYRETRNRPENRGHFVIDLARHIETSPDWVPLGPSLEDCI
jgi:hypothetical protein